MSWKIRERCRNILSRERNTIIKDPGGRIRIALAYPNRYHVGMSNLGFQSLYGWLNREEDVVCERVFLPDEVETALYEQSGLPLLTLETQKVVAEQDVLAFSVSFENDYLHILRLLELARIPLLSSRRTRPNPLVLAGGIAVSLNPEPLAPFFDLLALGDGEVLLPDLLDLLRSVDSIPLERPNVVRTAAGKPGYYAPGLYREVYGSDGLIVGRESENGAPEKVILARRKDPTAPIPRTFVMTPDTEFSDTVLVELGKGCGRGCRFCAEGHLFRPPRAYPADMLGGIPTEFETLGKRFGLICPAIGDLPNLLPLLRRLADSGCEATASALRGDSAREELLALLDRCGQKSVAIAPESGSQRLRDVINKKLEEEDILDAAVRLMEAGMTGIKLYFMVGLPTETEEDVEAVPALIKRVLHALKKHARKNKGLPRLNAGVSCFVPKAHTPFQWEALEHVDVLKKKIAALRKQCRSIGGVSLFHEVPKWSYTQALLSLGDRRAGRILEEVHTNRGKWWNTFKRTPLNPDFFVYRRKAFDEVLPWDFVDTGIKKDYLISEQRRAMTGKISPDCRPESCRRCGLCTESGEDGAAPRAF
jgi:radical SAM superfamily enzyme YgiQ (UPF0313 family)